MKDPARGGTAFRFGDGPRLRGGSDEHLAAGRANLAEGIPVDGSGGAPASKLAAVAGFIQISLLDADVFPIDIQFLRDEHGHGGFDALADFGVFGRDGEEVAWGDVDESGRDVILVGGRRLGKEGFEGLGVEREEEAAASSGRNFQEAATIEFRLGGKHKDHPFAF